MLGITLSMARLVVAVAHVDEITDHKLKDTRKRLGFRQISFHKFIEISDCPILVSLPGVEAVYLAASAYVARWLTDNSQFPSLGAVRGVSNLIRDAYPKNTRLSTTILASSRLPHPRPFTKCPEAGNLNELSKVVDCISSWLGKYFMHQETSEPNPLLNIVRLNCQTQKRAPTKTSLPIVRPLKLLFVLS
ncbi:hypothetical protein J6590_055681 [Homalodisca vitripennis]|nr:hypothetical protein J6590_055681 [Homalodisca vitripennis]